MRTITITAPGPQGIQGEAGAQGPPGVITNTGSFATTGSNQFNGNQTITGSLIQGLGNAAGENSHAEGDSTQAIGSFSHAEGLGTIAYGGRSHAEGQDTIASGSYSHAEGYQTIALADHQHVQGRWNAASSVPAAFIVGNGTDDSNRSNLIHAAGNEFQITGSLSISGSLTLSSGSALNINDRFYVNGNKQFNYGAFSSTLTQSGSANTILSMSFNTTDVGGYGVSVVGGTKITVANTGIYNIQFSAQLDRTSSGTNIVSIWFAYTGSNIANSATDVVLAGSTLTNPHVAAWNYVLPMSASSYVEIYWSHDDNVDNKVELKAVGTRSNPTRPAVPSVIATLTQIA